MTPTVDMHISSPAPSAERQLKAIGIYFWIPFLVFAATVAGCGTVNGMYQKMKGEPHSVTITWEPSVSHVIGYNVYRSDASGSNFTKLTGQPVFATKYTDLTVEAGKSYTYYVSAVNSNGVESKPSENVTVKVPSP